MSGTNTEVAWDLQFEHIDWNDIVEAEQSGDMETLQSLKDKSRDLKRSFSLPSPAPPLNDPQAFTSPQQSLPFEDWDDVHSPPPSISSPSPISYAAIVGAKRTISDRTCLSPVEYCAKRVAYSTPKDLIRGVVDEPLDFDCTPESVGKPIKSNEAVQRRLFPTAKENASPLNKSQTKGSIEALTQHRLSQRQKQVNYGKNTCGYQKYKQTIPKWKRKPSDPMTPDKSKQVSTRAWQGQIRLWRRALHVYDPQTSEVFTSQEAALCQLPLISPSK